MTKRLVAILLVVVGLVAGGCGRHSAPKEPAMNKEASERAVAFYKDYFLDQDYGAAWDMSLGVFSEYKSREEFVQRETEFLETLAKRLEKPTTSLQQDKPYQIQEFDRVGDYLYLISDSTGQVLIWVTKQEDGWKVRDIEHYYGGPIPW